MSVSLFNAVPAGAIDAERHNLAMEKLSKAREDWNRERQQRLDDLINKTLNEQRHAKQYLEPCRVIKNVKVPQNTKKTRSNTCLLYTSPSPRDKRQSRMPSSA